MGAHGACGTFARALLMTVNVNIWNDIANIGSSRRIMHPSLFDTAACARSSTVAQGLGSGHVGMSALTLWCRGGCQQGQLVRPLCQDGKSGRAQREGGQSGDSRQSGRHVDWNSRRPHGGG